MQTFETPFGPFRCFKNDQNFYFHLSRGGYWEIDLIYNKLRKYYLNAKVILDVGAHIGSHSFLYSYLNPQAKILAFEPQKPIFELLKQNCSIRPNVIPFNTAVGHKITVAKLSRNAKNGENDQADLEYGDGLTMNLGGVSLGENGSDVPMVTLDSLQLNGCDFIKMDVEGAEGLVIQGGLETIKKYKPVICYEYSPQFDNTPMCRFFGIEKIPEVRPQLEAIGYTSFIHLEGDNWLAEA